MDEVFKSEFHYQEHTGVLTHKLTQPSEDLILARNARLRSNPGVLNDLGKNSEGGTWGRLMASVPQNMYEKAIRDGFDLNSKDAHHAGLEMNRFLQTPEGKTCLVQGD